MIVRLSRWHAAVAVLALMLSLNLVEDWNVMLESKILNHHLAVLEKLTGDFSVVFVVDLRCQLRFVIPIDSSMNRPYLTLMKPDLMDLCPMVLMFLLHYWTHFVANYHWDPRRSIVETTNRPGKKVSMDPMSFRYLASQARIHRMANVMEWIEHHPFVCDCCCLSLAILANLMAVVDTAHLMHHCPEYFQKFPGSYRNYWICMNNLWGEIKRKIKSN